MDSTTLLGLKLDEARTHLEAGGVGAHQITVRETAPPHADRATGDWRVLRCQLSENGSCEIIAAREQIHEIARPQR